MQTIDKYLSFILRLLAERYFRSQAEAILARALDLIQTCAEEGELLNLIAALIQAEDHRFMEHMGVDTRSILRVLILFASKRRLQGASTITQQLVRVISGEYKKTAKRKFKEICLAAWLDKRLNKNHQAIAYLSIAYFGWQMNGWKQAVIRLKLSAPFSLNDAAAVIARLKYPEPRNPSVTRLAQIKSRQIHILRMLSANRG
jgi:membrane peptidoglycan carboxypeptidase